MMIRAPVITICVAFLLICRSEAKPNGKSKKTKQVVPDIECDLRAGKVSYPEFIVKCPASCRETKQRVYGTGVFASISSICNAAIHNGVISNGGGKVIVKKMAGQAEYKGSLASGVRSLSLPNWRESFTVSVGKPKKGVLYPSTLDYAPSKPTTVKTGQKEAKTLPASTILPTMAVTDPTTTTTPEPTTTTTTTTTATTTTTTTTPPTTPTTTTAKPRAAVHKVRDAGSSHPYFASMAAAASARQSQNRQGKVLPQVFRGGPAFAGRFPSRINPGVRRPEAGTAIRRPPSPPSASAPRLAEGDSGHKLFPENEHSRGLSTHEQDSLLRAPESQGDPNCKVDIAFLMDGSWSIGKRRFKIQKDFLMEVSQALNVGMAGPMMGIIQYGDDPVTEFGLRQFSTSKDLKPAIDKIVQKGGLSNVGKALSYINKHYFSDANGNRGGAPNVAVILVDGWPTDKVEEASRLARESGINIFFVTIEGPDDNEKHNVVEPNFIDKAVCRTSGFFSLPVSSWFALRKAVQPLVKRVCDTDRLVCSKTCLNANDIAFVIDGSSSVGTGNFRTVLQFVANVTREFEISDTDTRVGAVQYTYEQRLEFAFGQHDTKADVLNAIKRISYWSGGTSTGAAITYVAEQLFSKSKPNKRKIMIVITDGRSYDDVRAPALAVHRQGVIAYSIGIAWAAQDELEYIATDPDRDHSFFVDEFDNLYKYVPKIIHNICQEFNSQPRN
ncbi:vitrin isoform X8 [Brachyhypopomus gauderio]|uniref:vitrin isoform X8 n=1 Tax=Brachyhypopomus gauderio TaxID=698409 RepID=UPI0040431ED5